MKIGIVTFHNTPNYGATLQCYALSRFLEGEGAYVEVVNYAPIHTTVQYLKSLFLGRRRSIKNIARVARFNAFVRRRLKLSGPAIIKPQALAALRERYDLVSTGSDEVWKVDHMRPLDPVYYLASFEEQRSRLISYAASSSTVTDLGKYADVVRPLLERLDAIAVRDPSTSEQVRRLTGREPVHVVDPTFLWDWTKEKLEPLHHRPYVAVYSWLDKAEFARVKQAARAEGLDVVCVGCRHPDADRNLIGIGPEEWLRLLKHADLVVTNFFHGVVFALLFGRPLYGHVDPAKRMKLMRVLELAGQVQLLHADLAALPEKGLAGCRYDAQSVAVRFAPLISESKAYLRREMTNAARGKQESMNEAAA